MNEIQPVQNRTPANISLTPTTSLDLSSLPEAERNALIVEFSKGVLDLNKKSSEMHVDSAALKRTLDELTRTAQAVAADGNSITATHVQSTSLGRTEVIIGNTETAARGKISSQQRGGRDLTPYYIFAVIIAVVLIAVLRR